MTSLCTEVSVLRKHVAAWRAGGKRIALVPTMGALHAGHMALVAAAQEVADRVIVTIFVNPKQFAPGEDLSAYPRDLERDRAMVEAAGADLVFAPDLKGMYPPSFATLVTVEGPAAVGLEDKFRPGHFAGVATIVVKLLMQVEPQIALFGEKDFQQLKMIETIIRDLDISIEILAIPVVREADGLALSSRNVYLDADQRAVAPLMHEVIVRCAAAIAGGAPIDTSLEDARRRIAQAGFVVDYVEARRADTLAPLDDRIASGARSGRVLAAARLGTTRLIDNVAIGPRRALPSLQTQTR